MKYNLLEVLNLFYYESSLETTRFVIWVYHLYDLFYHKWYVYQGLETAVKYVWIDI